MQYIYKLYIMTYKILTALIAFLFIQELQQETLYSCVSGTPIILTNNQHPQTVVNKNLFLLAHWEFVFASKNNLMGRWKRRRCCVESSWSISEALQA